MARGGPNGPGSTEDWPGRKKPVQTSNTVILDGPIYKHKIHGVHIVIGISYCVGLYEPENY